MNHLPFKFVAFGISPYANGSLIQKNYTEDSKYYTSAYNAKTG